MAKRTILLYGRTRSGKTTLIGELAEANYVKTGKKTLLYTIDKGKYASIEPYIDLGVIDVVAVESTSPWNFLDKVATGQIRKDGKWVPADLSAYEMVAIEGITPFCDAFMENLADRSAAGESFGGQANVSFSSTSDGETIKIGGSNMAHYNIVQTRITSRVWKSQALDVPIVLWTASVSKDDDSVSSNKVLGPAAAGKALTSEIPRWFDLTFRLDCTPARGAEKEKHILYLGNSQDLQAGNATSLGNTRTPIDSIDLPPAIEPASLVKALSMIDATKTGAVDAIRKRITKK